MKKNIFFAFCLLVLGACGSSKKTVNSTVTTAETEAPLPPPIPTPTHEKGRETPPAEEQLMGAKKGTGVSIQPMDNAVPELIDVPAPVPELVAPELTNEQKAAFKKRLDDAMAKQKKKG